jgi:hypothetical protein
MIRIQVLQSLETIFALVESWASVLRERCAVCPDCGRNRYSGEPCVGAK